MFPLRGRQRELESLLDAWRSVTAGAVQLVVVAGEPGAGKTRLVQEFYSELSRQFDQSTPGFSEGYWPDLFKSGLGQDSLVPPPYDPQAKRPRLPYLWWGLSCRQGNESQRESFQPYADGLEQLNDHLVGQLRGLLVREAWGEVAHGLVFGSMEFVPLLGPLIKGIYSPVRGLAGRLRKLRTPLKFDERTLRGGSPAPGTGSLEELIIQLIAQLNNEQDKRLPCVPVCIVIDDAQWADARSSAFTQRLLELAVESGWRLLVLATVRSNELAAQMDRVAGTGGGTASTFGELVQGLARRATADAVVQLDLSAELPEQAMRQLLKDQLPRASDQAIEALRDRVGGHPYFAVNYARLVEEEGWLDPAGELAVGPEALSGLPAEVSAIIDRRLNLLARERRRVLNWSSVQGCHFVDAFIGRAAAKLEEEQARALLQLDGLQREHGLVSPLPQPPAGERMYQFAHHLIYERVRDGFDPGLQEYRLVRIALWELLREHLHGGILEQWPLEDQLSALQFIYDFATEGGAAAAAEQQTGSTLATTSLLAAVRIIELLHARGDFLAAEPLADWVLEQVRPLVDSAAPAENPALLLDALAALATEYNVRGRWNDWQACAQAWRDASELAEDTENALAAQLSLAELASLRGDYDDALALYEDIAREAERQGNRAEQAETLDGMGHILVFRAEFDRAQELFSQARAIFSELNDELGSLEAEEGLGDVCRARIELDKARGHYQAALEGYRRLGAALDEARVLRCLAALHMYREELDPAEELLNQSLELEQRLGCEAYANEARRNLALLMVRRGTFEEAIRIIEQSLAVTRRLGDRHGEARNLQSLGTTCMRLQRNAEALDYMDQSRAIYASLGDTHTEAMTLVNIGMINSYTAQDAEALDYYQRAEERFVSLGDQFHSALAAGCRAWALICLNRLDESIAVGERALAMDGDQITYFNVSLAKWLRGEPDAVEHYRQGIARYGNSPDVLGLGELVTRGLTTQEQLSGLAAAIGSGAQKGEPTKSAS